MKKFLTTLMLMIVFLIPVAQAEILEPGFTASYATVSHDVTPGLFTASASIPMERTRMACMAGDNCVDNDGTPGDQDRNSAIASIGTGSGGVSGGGTIGVIRS